MFEVNYYWDISLFSYESKQTNKKQSTPMPQLDSKVVKHFVLSE